LNPVCYVVDVNDTSTDDDFVRKATTHGTATRNHFAADLQSSTSNGQLILDQWQIVAVGGRRSNVNGFAEQAARGITFSARNGQVIYFTIARSSVTKEHAVKAGLGRTAQILTAPAYNATSAYIRDEGIGGFGRRMVDTLNPALNLKAYQTVALGVKERTVIRFFSAAHGFNGHAVQPSCTGAYISLRLRQHFQL
jgi:hypothetical protein